MELRDWFGANCPAAMRDGATGRTDALRALPEGARMQGGTGMTDAFDTGFHMKRASVAAESLGDHRNCANIVAQLRGF